MIIIITKCISILHIYKLHVIKRLLFIYVCNIYHKPIYIFVYNEMYVFIILALMFSNRWMNISIVERRVDIKYMKLRIFYHFFSLNVSYIHIIYYIHLVSIVIIIIVQSIYYQIRKRCGAQTFHTSLYMYTFTNDSNNDNDNIGILPPIRHLPNGNYDKLSL